MYLCCLAVSHSNVWILPEQLIRSGPMRKKIEWKKTREETELISNKLHVLIYYIISLLVIINISLDTFSSIKDHFSGQLCITPGQNSTTPLQDRAHISWKTGILMRHKDQEHDKHDTKISRWMNTLGSIIRET